MLLWYIRQQPEHSAVQLALKNSENLHPTYLMTRVYFCQQPGHTAVHLALQTLKPKPNIAVDHVIPCVSSHALWHNVTLQYVAGTVKLNLASKTLRNLHPRFMY